VKRPDRPILTSERVQSCHTLSSSSHSDGISTGLRLAYLFLSYTHLFIFIDLSCHVVCFSQGFLLRFWHSLHISSHSMVFAVTSFVLLVFVLFRILEYLVIGIFFEILCMKIIFCLCFGLILIYLGHLDCDLCFCNTWAFN
jgi:hypothetical protein